MKQLVPRIIQTQESMLLAKLTELKYSLLTTRQTNPESRIVTLNSDFYFAEESWLRKSKSDPRNYFFRKLPKALSNKAGKIKCIENGDASILSVTNFSQCNELRSTYCTKETSFAGVYM